VSQVARSARHSRIDSRRASVSIPRDNSTVSVSTHPQLFERAVSQCVWRDEYGELPRRTAVAERVCEYGGACSRVSHASDVYSRLCAVPGRYASLITSCVAVSTPNSSQYSVPCTYRAIHVLIDCHCAVCMTEESLARARSGIAKRRRLVTPVAARR
jgi:hypothetical protein